jgi:hypothetical protein
VLPGSQFVGWITTELLRLLKWRRLDFVKNFTQATTRLLSYHTTCLVKAFEVSTHSGKTAKEKEENLEFHTWCIFYAIGYNAWLKSHNSLCLPANFPLWISIVLMPLLLFNFHQAEADVVLRDVSEVLFAFNPPDKWQLTRCHMQKPNMEVVLYYLNFNKDPFSREDYLEQDRKTFLSLTASHILVYCNGLIN